MVLWPVIPDPGFSLLDWDLVPHCSIVLHKWHWFGDHGQNFIDRSRLIPTLEDIRSELLSKRSHNE